jgi:UDP-N-acetyl-D-galactosamine dehydrogenase
MMIANGSKIRDAKVLVLGTTFKEDVPDFRNSKVTDLITELLEYKMDVSVHDPFLEVGEAVPSLPELSCVDLFANKEYDAVILAVGHKEYRAMAASYFRKFYSSSIVPVMIDIQAILNSDDWEEGSYWQL